MAETVKLTAELIHSFSTAFLLKDYDDPVPTPDFHLELWSEMCLPNRKVAVAAPRGHAKSTAVTHAFTLANICFRKAQFIVLVSDTEGQAVLFLGDIKNELRDNELLRETFSIKRFVKDRETDVIVEFSDGYQVCIMVRGSEQKTRGLKWRNKRPDLIICDDLENDDIVLNEERRDKFRRWFYNALLPSGSRNSRVRIVGTILHMDSLLERLMPKPGAKTTTTRPLSDRGVGQKDGKWRSIRYRAHDPEFEHILWEEHRGEEWLRAERQSYIDQGFPEGYSQEYLNYPIDEENAYFRKDDFVELVEDGEPENFYIAGDLAISEKKTRAYSVFVVVGVTPSGVIRVRDVVRFRGDSLEIVDEMFDLVRRYSPDMFFLEQENIARSLGPLIYKEMEKTNTFFNLVPMAPIQDKIKRARAMQARMRAHNVEFPHDAEWFADFQTELLQFPRGAYKDQVDAFAWIGLGLQQLIEAKTHAELEEEEYEDEMDASYSVMELGASAVTGY